MSEISTHPLVVHARDDGYLNAAQGSAAYELDSVDPREQVLVQPLISSRSVGATDMSMGIGRFRPGMYHIKHHHPNGSEFYYFVNGHCLVHVDGDDVRASPGTAIYLPANCVHAIKNDTDEVVELVWGLSKPAYKEMGLIYDE